MQLYMRETVRWRLYPTAQALGSYNSPLNMCRNACCSKQVFNKGSWSAAEDKILADHVRAHGEGSWGKVPKRAGLNRCPRSCRLRWMNYLRPGIKRGNISHEEEDLIIRLHNLLGNRWSLIAGRLPGRTDNEIKNYWNTVLKKKVLAQSALMKIMRFNKDEDRNCKREKKIRCQEFESSPSCNEASVTNQHDDRNICKKESKEPLISREHDMKTSLLDTNDCDMFNPWNGLENETLYPRHLLDIDPFEIFGNDLQKDMRFCGGVDSPMSFSGNVSFSEGIDIDNWFGGGSIQPYDGMSIESFFQSESEYLSLWTDMVEK